MACFSNVAHRKRITLEPTFARVFGWSGFSRAFRAQCIDEPVYAVFPFGKPYLSTSLFTEFREHEDVAILSSRRLVSRGSNKLPCWESPWGWSGTRRRPLNRQSMGRFVHSLACVGKKYLRLLGLLVDSDLSLVQFFELWNKTNVL